MGKQEMSKERAGREGMEKVNEEDEEEKWQEEEEVEESLKGGWW
jgi:hypothetical protein